MSRLKRTFRPRGFLSNRNTKRVFIIPLLLGIVAGFVFSHIVRQCFMSAWTTDVPCRSRAYSTLETSEENHSIGISDGRPVKDIPIIKSRNRSVDISQLRPRSLSMEISDNRSFLLVSVMTADHLLAARAETIHRTWGNRIDSGKVLYFLGEVGNTTSNLSVIRLPGVNDSYPPQKKSFSALKYIYDNYINDFHWFVRADDDVYIRSERLSKLLRSLDSSQDVLIGHAGVGKPDEKGKLGLQDGDNFCLGGPGVVMSQSVLRKVAPHFMMCLNETASFHEDVELGRCIRKYVGVICPWAQETRNLFHQIFGNTDLLFSGNLDKKGLTRAITVHPVKKPEFMYRLHHMFLSSNVQLLQDRASKLYHRFNRIKRLLSDRSNKTEGFEKGNFYGRLPRNSSSHWEYFDQQYLYGVKESAVEWINGRTLEALKKILAGVIDDLNVKAQKQLKSPEEMKKMKLGVMRIYATQGMQFTIDVNTLLKPSVPDIPERPRQIRHYVHFQQGFAPLLKRIAETNGVSSTVHFIVPLAGRFDTFQRFLNSFEKAFLKPGKRVSLLIVYFPDVSSPQRHNRIFNVLRTKYPEVKLKWLELAGEFSRARALELGTNSYGDDALLFFSDVDLIFTTEFYERCRINTSPGQRIYFPIMFSQFHPKLAYRNRTMPTRDTRVFTKRAGTWRKYSYGPVCVYAGDVRAVGGLNTTIQGWGLEDLDFYEKCLRYKLDVLRSPDLGLLHIYHPQTNCSDPRMNDEQASMCEDSKLQGLGSAESLADYLMSKGYV